LRRRSQKLKLKADSWLLIATPEIVAAREDFRLW